MIDYVVSIWDSDHQFRLFKFESEHLVHFIDFRQIEEIQFVKSAKPVPPHVGKRNDDDAPCEARDNSGRGYGPKNLI